MGAVQDMGKAFPWKLFAFSDELVEPRWRRKGALRHDDGRQRALVQKRMVIGGCDPLDPGP